MSNDSDKHPPDKDRLDAEMDATIVPSAHGSNKPSPHVKPPHDMDATIAPAAHGVDNDATMPIERGTSGADPKSDSVESFSPRLERIGDCKIEKRLGVGGFGEVWLATQESDLLKRRVAIKLLKRGMDSDSVLARFDLERKVLSTLNHPNISRLLGAGITEDGRSYFIMEFVDGLTLDLWCKRQSLTVTERLAIFRQVCSAVAHAHSLGIVHRDLKPANIIVGPDGVPKLLDFGIAKIINTEVSEVDRAQTLPGDVGPLSPMYASPEQLRGEPLVASTDIYSLGVILYETLTEQLPFDFANMPFEEIRRKVCETQPLLPSNICTKMAVAPLETRNAGELTKTQSPQGNKERLSRRLRGDLDNIVLMAMRKEPGRRYASVDALIADIDAHSASMPISARPTSAGYRAHKWMGRNRFQVSLAVTVVAAVVSGIGWYFYAQRTAAKDKIVSAKEVIQNNNRQLVQKRFEELGPNYAQDPEKSLPILDDREKIIRDDLKITPDNSENLRKLFGVLFRKSVIYNVNRNIQAGLLASAEQLEIAKKLYEESKSTADRRFVALALQIRGDIFYNGNELQKAQEMYLENLKIRESMYKEKPDDLEAARDVSKALIRMRDLDKQQGDLAKALEYSTQALTLRTTVMKQAKGLGDPAKMSQFESEWLLASQWHAEDLRNLDRLEEAEFEIGQFLALANKRNADKESSTTQRDVNIGETLLCDIYVDKQDLKKALSAANRMVKAAEASIQLSKGESRGLEIFVSSGSTKANVQAEMQDAQDSLDTIQSTVTSAKRLRAGAKIQIQGDAIATDLLLTLYAYEMRALRMLGQIDKAKEIAKNAAALMVPPQEGAKWFMATAFVYAQSALLEAQPEEAIRLAKLAVGESLKSKNQMLQLEIREVLLIVLRKFSLPEDVKIELDKAVALASCVQRPRAAAIMKRMTGNAKADGSVDALTVPAAKIPDVAP